MHARACSSSDCPTTRLCKVEGQAYAKQLREFSNMQHMLHIGFTIVIVQKFGGIVGRQFLVALSELQIN